MKNRSVVKLLRERLLPDRVRRVACLRESRRAQEAIALQEEQVVEEARPR